MTLLVIEIPRPEEMKFSVGHGVSKAKAFDNLAHFLGGQWDAFYAYFLTFLILWIVWRQHHRMFDQFSRVTPRMVGWHFPLLLFAAFLPYASSTYGHYADNPMAALLYGLVVAVVLFCRTLIQAEGLRDGVLIEGAGPRRLPSRTDRLLDHHWLLGPDAGSGLVDAVGRDPLALHLVVRHPDSSGRTPPPARRPALARNVPRCRGGPGQVMIDVPLLPFYGR